MRFTEIAETHFGEWLAHGVGPHNRSCIVRYISSSPEDFILMAFNRSPSDNNDPWKIRHNKELRKHVCVHITYRNENVRVSVKTTLKLRLQVFHS